MVELFETICIEDGVAHHLEYHHDRLHRARYELFGYTDTIDIAKELRDIPTSGVYRAKLIYNVSILSLDYYPYTLRKIEQISIVESDIDYNYKYLDRALLDSLLTEKSSSDEILLTRDGLLTDTTIANIALRREDRWYTPAQPLLEGTTRARLIDSGFLLPIDIEVSTIESYDGLALMNAMIGFEVLEKGIEGVLCH